MELEDQEKAVVAAERQYTELARQQEVLRAQVAAQRHHRDVLREELKHLAALRSQRLGQLAENWQNMNALHAPPDVNKRVAELLPRNWTARDSETFRTVRRLLVAADHLRRIGNADVAAKVSRETDLLAKQFTATAQTGTQPPTEPSGRPTPPETDRAPAKRVIELRLVSDHLAIVIGLSATDDGGLAGIRVGQVRLLSVDQLRTRLLAMTHGADGPPLTAEFDADEKLAFVHLARAVQAVSTHVDQSGQRKPSIDNVIPLRLPDAIEELEEFDEIEDEPAPRGDPKASPRLNIELDPPPKGG